VALKTEAWLRDTFRPLVMAAMVGCVAWSAVELIRSFWPPWNGTFLVVGCVLVALEAHYSYRLLRTRRALRFSATQFRVAEFAVILSALKIGSYVGDGWARVVADVRAWPQDPSLIFDPEAMVAFGLAILSWAAVTQSSHDLERLGEPPERHPAYTPPLESLTHRFFWGGAILLVCAGFTRVALSEALDLERPPVPGLVLNALIYFLLGLVMLGQAQFTRLHRQWQVQETTVAKDLGRRWARYSLAFVGLAALMAFLSPIGYASDLLSMASTGLALGVYVLTVFIALLYMICGLPLAWLLSLFSGEQEPLPERMQALPQPPPQVTQPGDAAAPDWFAILRAVVFWVIVLGVLFYLARRYLRDRPGLGQALTRVKPVGRLYRLWEILWRWLKIWTARLGQSVGERLPRRSRRAASAPGMRRPRFFRLGALPPREQVARYYLNVLRRAREQGLGRERHQTPYEYQATLESSLSQVQQEVEALTQAFVEARYSRQEVEAGTVRGVRAYWARIKAALRKRKGGNPA
jgi:hypothetical protein